jgi:hypothetical protein
MRVTSHDANPSFSHGRRRCILVRPVAKRGQTPTEEHPLHARSQNCSGDTTCCFSSRTHALLTPASKIPAIACTLSGPPTGSLPAHSSSAQQPKSSVSSLSTVTKRQTGGGVLALLQLIQTGAAKRRINSSSLGQTLFYAAAAPRRFGPALHAAGLRAQSIPPRPFCHSLCPLSDCREVAVCRVNAAFRWR